MNELEQKEILDLLESLPKPIKEAIENSSWDMKLSVIAKKHGLLLDQITQLENLILMIMLGVIDPKKIKGEMLELNIDSQKADQMIVEIENEIFQKLKQI
jgi:aspartate carbamoyltransferase regulatory subunit